MRGFKYPRPYSEPPSPTANTPYHSDTEDEVDEEKEVIIKLMLLHLYQSFSLPLVYLH